MFLVFFRLNALLGYRLSVAVIFSTTRKTKYYYETEEQFRFCEIITLNFK